MEKEKATFGSAFNNKNKVESSCWRTCEVVWLRRILSDLKLPQMQPTTLHCDNQSAIKMMKIPIYHSKTKHVEIQHHDIREQVQNKVIELIYCRSQDQVAGIFTKAINWEKFEKFQEMLGVVENEINIKRGC